MIYTTLIGAQELGDRLHDPRLAVIDCRYDLGAAAAGRADFLAAHVPGARYADLGADLSGPLTPGSGRHPLPEPGVLAARFAALGLDAADQIVAYDAGSGAFAARLWWLARWLGHRRVAVLDGGFAAWRALGLPTQSGDGSAAAPGAAAPGAAPLDGGPVVTRFQAAPDDSAWLTSGAVIAALRDPKRLLVDARAPERFTGAVEPIDPVAGHVPGAVNHPFALNLGADGRFLAPGELRRRWLTCLGGRAPADAIAMCGSGVTACHNLLALEVAGLPGAKLYAGSWSEWIQESARPVAKGTGEEPR
jgi:thiosulfate/3-mercaptopyruvate sulfurtransferase